MTAAPMSAGGAAHGRGRASTHLGAAWAPSLAVRRLLVGLAVQGMLLAGCGRGPELERVVAERERRIRQMEQERSRLRAERRRAQERVRELEAQLALLRAEVEQLRSGRWSTVRIGGERQEAPAERGQRRRSGRARARAPEPTVVLRVEEPPQSDPAADPGEGDLGVVPEAVRPRAEPEVARVEAAASPAPASRPAATSRERPSGAFVAAYRRALEALRAGRFEQALGALREAERAGVPARMREGVGYWRAEALYGLRRYREALRAFERFLAGHARSRRAPDALWKVVLCRVRLGDEEGARRARKRLIEEYPGTMAARLAARDEEDRS